jgi:hypothetical protein
MKNSPYRKTAYIEKQPISKNSLYLKNLYTPIIAPPDRIDRREDDEMDEDNVRLGSTLSLTSRSIGAN